MLIRELSLTELLAIRPWLASIVNSGRAFIKIRKDQIPSLIKRLEEVDRELLFRIVESNIEDEYQDGDFEKTLKSLRPEEEKKEEEKEENDGE